jgi:hypothetical protein
MNTEVTNLELTIILLASISSILIVLFIVGKWLNFHLLTCCFNLIRKRKKSTTISVREQSTQVEITFIQQQKEKNNYRNLFFPLGTYGIIYRS